MQWEDHTGKKGRRSYSWLVTLSCFQSLELPKGGECRTVNQTVQRRETEAQGRQLMEYQGCWPGWEQVGTTGTRGLLAAVLAFSVWAFTTLGSEDLGRILRKLPLFRRAFS